MAGISNVSLAPEIAAMADEHYGRALAAMKEVLDSPAEAIADTTLMAAISLGLFEVLTPATLMPCMKPALRFTHIHIYSLSLLRTQLVVAPG